jgi:GNAT superfamily N-acetyltransferase
MTRAASVDDLPAIVRLKLLMIGEAGLAHLFAEDVSVRALTRYTALYAAGAAQHFVVEQDERIIACVGAFLKDDLPFCFHRPPAYGFIGDVYTEPEHRRRGYARQLTLEAIHWLRSQGAQMIRLLATPQARPLYEEMGFQPSDEMVLWCHESAHRVPPVSG